MDDMLGSSIFPVYFAILPYNTIILFKFLIYYYIAYNGSYRKFTTKHFCTRCIKHFMEQQSLQQHALHCTNEVEPDNLIDALRVTGGYSKEVRKKI